MYKREDSQSFVDSELIGMLEVQKLGTISKAWMDIYLDRKGLIALYPEDLSQGINYLGLSESPFEIELQDMEAVILDHWYNGLDIYKTITNIKKPLMVFGTTGGGKTATAIWTARQDINFYQPNPKYFPIYYPLSHDPSLNELGNILSDTLSCYLAHYPHEFIQNSQEDQHRIMRVWNLYCGTAASVINKLKENGLPGTGDGLDMERRLRDRMGDIPRDAPPEKELIKILGRSHPSSYHGIRVILDWKNKSSFPDLKGIHDFMQRLLVISQIISVAFLPERKTTKELLFLSSSPISQEHIVWNADHLKKMLKWKLKCSKRNSEESIEDWCDEIAKLASPVDRLIKASKGTPKGLNLKGNDLIKKVGKKQCLLSVDDLDNILGPEDQTR
jgi:hypothetical protein